MKRNIQKIILVIAFLSFGLPMFAWVGMPTPRLQVDGRYLKDPHGNIVNLHGVAITPSPWFNGGHVGEWRWTDYDVEGCLAYNNSIIDALTDTENGWYMSYIRLHMDPHWTNTPGCVPDGHELPNCFNVDRFIKYLDEVYIPMAEYAISRGLYVVLRPPGVAPHVIGVEDDYNYAEYLMTVWDIVSNHPWIQSRDEIMLELANEPVEIRLADGSVGANSQAHFDVLVEIFQPIVDRIRENGFHNVLWIPGSGYQSHYKGFAVNPIKDENIGYAVHIYPGYWGGVKDYDSFRSAWDENVKPVADFAPIMITEIDWSPDGVDAWGDGTTGVAGGDGFGANFKMITDESGNVSWNLLAPENLLHRGEPDGELAYGGDPEACAYPTFHWWQEYATYEYPRPYFENRSISDNGDGTFSNPVIFADFPNADIILAADKYYMVSSAQHISGGLTLLKSNDLINWEYSGNPLQRTASDQGESVFNDITPNGQAGIKFHDGYFYIVFNSSDNKSYLLSSDDPEGIWFLEEMSRFYENPALLFNGDEIFIIHGKDEIQFTELDDNFDVINGSTTLIADVGAGFNGVRAYVINGQYYITLNDEASGNQKVYRSHDLTGEFEEQLLLDEPQINGVTIIETQTGEWWSMLSYNSDVFGQLPVLKLVTWDEGWPGITISGNILTDDLQKPNVGMSFFSTELQTNDNFRHYQIGSQWGWYNTPDHSKWSLFERPGFLRLQTTDVVNDLPEARNTLTQRIFGYHSNDIDAYVTIRLDISEMLDGDIAGLALLQNPYAFIGITIESDEKKIVFNNNGDLVYGPVVTEPVVFLRSVVDVSERTAIFYYSFDNADYVPFGEEFSMGYDESFSLGSRFAIFNYATLQEGGFVDVDWFSTEAYFAEDMFYDPNFVGYTEDQLTLESLSVGFDELTMLRGSSRSLIVNAVYKDESVENVVRRTNIQNSNPEIAEIINGQIVAKSDGITRVTVSFSGELAGSETIHFDIVVSTFPLTNELFNPSIWEQGTFDEITGELVTGQWGFGGWTYDQGLDLSDYKHLIVRLKQPTTSNASFRIFDQTSYWSEPYAYDVGSDTEFVVPLSNMVKENSTKANPATIYIIGFWSNGGVPIVIDEIFLSNSEEYDVPSSINWVDKNHLNADEIVDVYSLAGVKVRSSITRRDAIRGLPQGIYIVGNSESGFEKVMVQRW